MLRKNKTLHRVCVECATRITVTLDRKTRRYTGGHYFSFGKKPRWWRTGKEYWECNKCFDEAQKAEHKQGLSINDISF